MRPDYQPPPQEPLRRGDYDAWAITSSLVLTAVAVLTVALTEGTALRVIGLAVMLLVAPFVAFQYGLRLGLLSTAVVVLYSIYYFSIPGDLFRYTDEDVRRLAALSALSLVLTLMIGALRHAVRRSEAQLRHQLSFANAITGSLGEGLYALDTRGCLTFMNPAAEQTLGWREEDLLGKNVHETIHAQHSEVGSRQGEECPLLTVLHSGNTYRMDDDTFITRDGRMFPVSYTSSPILTDGRVTGAVVAFRDITESKRAEEAVQESEARLRAVLDNSTAIIYVKDPDGRYMLVNRRLEELFHVTQEQVIGKTDHDIFSEEVANAFMENDRKVLDSGMPLELEEVAPHDDGLHTYISVKVPLKNAMGQPYAVCGISTDITRRKLAEDQKEEMLAQVERALELRGQFLSVASHELKTPVTLLKGYAQVLHQRAHLEGDIQTLKPLRVMNRQVDRMTRLIDDLLDVSRIEGGKIRFEMQPFHLNQALGEVISEVRMTAPEFELRVDERAADLWVMGDRARIQQVMTNLLTNAVKYSGMRKEVDVSIQREGDRAVVSVTDYGIGIPEGSQSGVFGLYFRAPNASVNNYGGLGMGLYISKRIIDRHGGTIGFVSEEGQGSTFYFSLPLTMHVSQMAEPATAEA